MNHWHTIRRKASEIHNGLFTENESAEIKLDAEEILQRLEEQTGISRQKVSKDDPILQKSIALIVPDFEALFINDELPAWYSAFCQAHEYGHFFLHHQTEAHCSEKDIEFTGAEESPIQTGENRISGYSSRERREREANLFAAELLFPSEVLRVCFLKEGWRAKDFALKTQFPFDFICRQLNFALLVSDTAAEISNDKQEDKKKTAKSSLLELDPSQARAAYFEGKKMLVEAGPGTGKTRTLIGRILYLLRKGVQPENILALTFSNKAADEMRERISVFAPNEAPRIWLGTFHAFGLEILRKYGDKIGIDKDFELLDPIDAQILLENHLLELKLDHYKSLHFPAQNLKSIYTAIQRAKDELAGWEDYKKAATENLQAAEEEKEITAAQKELEVAGVYRFYEQLIRKNNWLDFGDLISQAINVLQNDAETKQKLRTKYTHILVDEFQDVNRASSKLLSELSGKDGDLWIVGDARQTVYRWRGASAANLKYFRTDFPDAEYTSLEINYRSEEKVVDLLNEFAPNVIKLKETQEFKNWDVPDAKKLDKKGKIKYTESPDFPTECEYIAEKILEETAGEKSLKDIAILGRTNSILSKIADELIEREIPVLYLGNIFERAEIRDMLSLLSLSFENKGRHLLRLTGFDEYNFSTECVRQLISSASAENNEQNFPAALALAESCGDLSIQTKDHFAKLAEHFEDVDESVSAWQFLSSYLFDRSNFLLPILQNNSIAARQQKFAVYQLLQFALSEESKTSGIRFQEENPRRRFIKMVRYLAQSGEESAFRKLPTWAEKSIDAVRLLTVHAAKGLEFETVFLPYLGNAYFPTKQNHNACPLPNSLFGDSERDEKAEHTEEEKCLFFVAASRAEKNLYLSNSKNYGQASKPSRFLDLIKENLPDPYLPESAVPGEEIDLNIVRNDDAGKHASRYTYSFSEINIYRNCPRRYFYEYVLSLRGNSEEAAFVQFHGAVREVISWAKNKIILGEEISDTKVKEKLHEIWDEKSIKSHPYNDIYLDEAEKLVSRAIGFISPQTDKNTELKDMSSNPLEFSVAGKRIRLYPDFFEINPQENTVKIQKIKTGKTKLEERNLSEDEKFTIAALFQAASENYPDSEILAAFEYIAAGENFTYNPKNIKTQLKHLEKAVDGIASRDFEPNINSQKCPKCPHYFICPGGDLS